MWENGKKLPSLSHVVFLAELYSCSLDELVISYRRSREADDGDQSVPFFIFHMVCQGRTHGYAFVLLYVTPGLYSNASTDGIMKSQNPKRNIGQQTDP